MKITYQFADGSKSEVEVSDDLGTVIMDSRREESNLDRKERYHCWSMDAAEYEGEEYGIPDFTDDLIDDTDEKVREAFSHLSETQRRRMLMLSEGMSIREIARSEGKDFSSVRESIEAARKKFLKNY